MMNKIKGSQDDVKTINMFNAKMSKQITPLKILLDMTRKFEPPIFTDNPKRVGLTYPLKLYL